MNKTGKKVSFDKVLLYATTVITLLIAGVMIKDKTSKPSIAYVDIGRLVNEYAFKKELENNASQNLYSIKEVIDSLNVVKKVAGEHPVPAIDSQLYKANQVFDQYYKMSNQDINQKIWDRLNPLLEKYGQERTLGLIIGANGAGTVLYGDKKIDVTDDVIRYINEKHEKGI